MIELRGFEIGFNPKITTIDKPGRYTLTLINEGVLPHDITFPDGTKIVVNVGETKSGDVTIPATGVDYICRVAGHEQAGAVSSIRVK